MARRGASAAVALVCFFATIIAGWYVDAATAQKEAGTLDGTWAYASAIATTVREKVLEYAGATAEDGVLPLVLVGAGAAMLAAFTLYLLSVYLDREPFLFNGGKMGKLEAQSCYTKKSC
eukprot:g13288.t1